MINVLNANGLVTWNEDEIKFREYAIERIQSKLRQALVAQNRAWTMHRFESSCLIPSSLVNPNYTSDDVFIVEGQPLTLRPETTAASYLYADKLMKEHGVYPPLVVWQAGKSFRNEQDQVTKNMRLKEFYQLEFQCVYADDTKADYILPVIWAMQEVIEELSAGFNVRRVPSDRLPSYSKETTDIEVDNGEKWMEVMSISDRTDYTARAFIGNNEKGFRVLEVAVGLDRLVYNRFTASKKE